MEQNRKKELNIKEIIKILKNGGVGALKTDTLFGLVGLALNKKAVLRIYKLKQRNPKKPFIILISNFIDLEKFGVLLNDFQKKILKKIWPNKISVVLNCPNLKKELSYLRPIKKTLAFRFPKNKRILSVINQTGPLVAPSCNPEGESPALDKKQAKDYFSDKLDFYFGNSVKKDASSTLIEIKNNNVNILRQGEIKIKEKI